jgi:NADPH-dependent 2,4-dienoyl-CoA reductase/sulfur reductase-like enzyme
MKRTRSTRSLEMAPGKNNEGFHDASMQNGTSDAHSVTKDDMNHVTVVGAGPAGLMLA